MGVGGVRSLNHTNLNFLNHFQCDLHCRLSLTDILDLRKLSLELENNRNELICQEYSGQN